VLQTLRSLSSLIYPPYCLICFKAGEQICNKCKQNWQQVIKSGKFDLIPQFFTNYYNPESMKLILAAKENGNLIARKLLATSILNSLNYAICQLKLIGEINLVSIPSRGSAVRKRGRSHIDELANEIVTNGKEMGLKITHQKILHLIKKVKDQSNLNKLQRSQNMSGAYLAIAPKNSINNLIIIDDLITTGASIHEGIRALSVINLRPVAIITACAVTAHL
jgi:predicted amidophosphoribosyltransferase